MDRIASWAPLHGLDRTGLKSGGFGLDWTPEKNVLYSDWHPRPCHGQLSCFTSSCQTLLKRPTPFANGLSFQMAYSIYIRVCRTEHIVPKSWCSYDFYLLWHRKRLPVQDKLLINNNSSCPTTSKFKPKTVSYVAVTSFGLPPA